MFNYLKLFYLTLFLCLCLKVSAKSENEEGEPLLKLEASFERDGYEGETMVYQITLLSSTPNVSNVKIKNAPVFPPGCRVMDGGTGINDMEEVSIDGKTFFKWIILKDYVTPHMIGKNTISRSRFLVFMPKDMVTYNNNSGGSRRVMEYDERLVECNSVDFKIKELPSAKKAGGSFCGCVGDFNIEASFVDEQFKKGEEALVVFKISGAGNLKDIWIPNLSNAFGSGCRLLEVVQNCQNTLNDSQLYSDYTITCKFIPEKKEFEIKPLTLVFFNPETKTYYKVGSENLQRSAL